MLKTNRRAMRAFTLIEILVVVAIIALLIAILVPTLKRAKEQAQRSVCAAHLHQIMLSMFAYAGDHKGTGPYRGFKNYTVAETKHEALGWGGNEKCMTNLGLLWKRWVGAQHNLLYCPAIYDITRDRTWTPGVGETIGGWKSVFVDGNNCYWSVGGYNYALIVPPRQGKGSCPSFRGAITFPPEVWNDAFKKWIATDWQDRNPGVTFKMPAVGVLVSDTFIGGFTPPHSNGKSVNVAYSDGHVRNHRIEQTGTSGAWSQNEQFWYFTTRP